MANETPKVADTRLRPQRIPVSGPRDILTVANKDPNYEYRWVNDVGNRLQRFKEGGWDIVTDDIHVIGQPVVDRPTKLGSTFTKSVGGQVTAVLMRIKKEWFEEDQRAKQQAIDDLEASTRAENIQKQDYGKIDIKRK